MDWKDYVDQFLYINLESRRDRNEEIINEFGRQGIANYRRIDGVYDPVCGHRGCTKSHIKALEYALTQNYEKVCIVEDDLVFLKSKEETLKLIKPAYILYFKHFDVFMLDLALYESEEDKTPITKILKASRSTGYIIKKHYIPILLENLKEGLSLLEHEIEQINIALSCEGLLTARQRKIIKGNLKNKIIYVKHTLDTYFHSLMRNGVWITCKDSICSYRKDSISNIAFTWSKTDRDFKLEAFYDMMLILTENNQHSFLICGTLLGMYRDNDFIEWDEDIDIGILETNLNKNIFNKIIETGLFIKFFSDNTIEDGFNIQFVHKNGTKIDFDIFNHIKDYSYTYRTGKYKWLRHIRGFLQTTFKNIEVNIPQNTGEWLIQEYGSDFFTPKIESHDQWLERMEKSEFLISIDA